MQNNFLKKKKKENNKVWVRSNDLIPTESHYV